MAKDPWLGRAGQRWATFARATARRLAADARRVFTVDPDKPPPVDDAELAAARELARSGGALRGGVAKLGQLMAYLEGPGAAADAEARAALSTLWDQLPAEDPDAIRRVVEEDLGAPPEQRFASWEAAPFAAASLGQVHRAALADGTALAVKVQYPAAAAALRDDLSSGALVRRLAGADVGGALDDAALDALRDGLLRELDYRAEAEALASFRAAFANDRAIVVPRPHPSLSSARVLTMDRLDGRPLAALAAAPQAVRDAAALTLFRFAFGGPLIHGLLNADPNPGNYLWLDAAPASDGKGEAKPGTIGFLDFGCAGPIDDALLAEDRRLWRAVLKEDGETMRHAVHAEGLLARAIVLDSDTYRAWEKLLARPFTGDGAFRWTPEWARQLAQRTSDLVRAGGLRLPPAALLLWRQRLGVAAVIAALEPVADFRAALVDIMARVPRPSTTVYVR